MSAPRNDERLAAGGLDQTANPRIASVTDNSRVQPTLWLATGSAASYFDPDEQSFADRQRWARMSEASRSRTDWSVSRALLAHVKPAAGASSVSHAGGFAALAVAPAGTRVGVDIESVDEHRDCLRLARHGFAVEESAAMARLDEAARPERFYSLWTLKEACIKALGLQLPAGLRECVFTFAQGKWNGKLPGGGGWTAHLWRPRPKLYLAAVSLPGVAEWTAREWPQSDACAWRPVLSITTGLARG